MATLEFCMYSLETQQSCGNMCSPFISKLFRRKTAISKSNGVSTAPPTISLSRQARISTVEKATLNLQKQGISVSPTLIASSPLPSHLTSPRASENFPYRPSEDLNLWARACEFLQDREPELLDDYKKHLVSLQDDTEPFNPTSVEPIGSRLMSDREKKQWHI